MSKLDEILTDAIGTVHSQGVVTDDTYTNTKQDIKALMLELIGDTSGNNRAVEVALGKLVEKVEEL